LEALASCALVLTCAAAAAALLHSMCSKLRWLLPYYTADERRQLLDSCLHTRLLQSYMPSSTGSDAV
jgi:hypothetical protein